MKYRLTRDKLPSDIKETIREMRDHISRGTQIPGVNFGVYSNEGGHGSTILPPAGKQQTYYEGRVGSTRSGRAGAYRVVLLVDDNTDALIRGYYTRDHYEHFHQFE